MPRDKERAENVREKNSLTKAGYFTLYEQRASLTLHCQNYAPKMQQL